MASSLQKHHGMLTSAALLFWITTFPCFLIDASTIPNPTKWIVRAKGISEQNPNQLWTYTGSLYDPLDGRKIANVQGLELVRKKRNDSDDDNVPLQISSILEQQNSNSTTYHVESCTLLSQKIFCYTTLNNNNDKTQQLLRQIRVRPQSPLKAIPLDQSVALFETATTFLSRRRRRPNDNIPTSNDNNNDNKKNNNNNELIVHSEWPDGQTLWGSGTVKFGEGGTTAEYTIFAKRRSRSSPMYQPDLTIFEDQEDSNGSNNADTIIAPRRSALIQIGPSTMESKHKFGARETYAWKSNGIVPKEEGGGMMKQPRSRWWTLPGRGTKSSSAPTPDDGSTSRTTLSFSRYGEAPPFYAPGRMCMLELQARPIDRMDQASPILQKLVSEQVEGWGGEFSNLRLKPEELPSNPHQRRKQQLQRVWGRLQAATTVADGGGMGRAVPR